MYPNAWKNIRIQSGDWNLGKFFYYPFIIIYRVMALSHLDGLFIPVLPLAKQKHLYCEEVNTLSESRGVFQKTDVIMGKWFLLFWDKNVFCLLAKRVQTGNSQYQSKKNTVNGKRSHFLWDTKEVSSGLINEVVNGNQRNNQPNQDYGLSSLLQTWHPW